MPTLERNPDLRPFIRRLASLALMIAVVLTFGTVGLAVAEGEGVWKSFIWALDTIATLGAIPAPDTTGGEIVKVVLVVTGVGTLFYALVTVTELFVAGHLTELLMARRLQRMTDSLRDHTIICGFGRVGGRVARDVTEAGGRCVVVDRDPSAIGRAQEQGLHAILGTASDDDVLRRAGIERAGAIVACVDSDAENIFMTLSARELRPEGLLIVARAGQEDAERKLRRAGADRVVSTYRETAAEMARLAMHPQISEVVGASLEQRLEEIDVVAGCGGAGRSIADVRGQAFVVGLRRDGRFVPRPPDETVLEAGDVLVAMGPSAAMDQLEARFDPGQRSAAG